jgi:transcriptional regulator with XRE-family HTH domain
MKIGNDRGAVLVQLIEEFCDQQCWSIREFARRSGVRHSTISAWKSSGVEPDTRSLTKIGLTMGLELSDLWLRLNNAIKEEPVDQLLNQLEKMPAEDLVKLISQASVILSLKLVAA